MKTVVSICVIATILVSCVPSKHFKMVVSDNEFYHDTVAQLNKMSRAQHGQIDSLEQALQLKQQIYSSDLSQKEQELETREQELAEKEKTMEELKNIVGLQQQAVYNLKQQVCDALKCFTPDELNVEIKNGKLYVSLSDKLLFPSGSDKVDDRGKEAIKQLSGVLKESEMEIMVEGHTDTVPIFNARNKDNWDLSAHRATSVTRLFTENGIGPNRLIAAGRGKYIPVSDNESEKGRQLNRRTEIVLAPKLDKLWELTERDNLLDYPKKISNLKY